jgi:hypothetical protein
MIILKFAVAHTLNGNQQKHGALCGCNGNNKVNIMATHRWRLENSFCRPNQLCEPVQNSRRIRPNFTAAFCVKITRSPVLLQVESLITMNRRSDV